MELERFLRAVIWPTLSFVDFARIDSAGQRVDTRSGGAVSLARIIGSNAAEPLRR
jgi:hypothetical protein